MRIPPERVHPVPAVRRRLPLRRDPRADRSCRRPPRARRGPAAARRGPALGPGDHRGGMVGWAAGWTWPLPSCIPPFRLAERMRLEETGQVGRDDRRQRRLPQHGPDHRRAVPRGRGNRGTFPRRRARGCGAWVGLVIGRQADPSFTPPPPQRLRAGPRRLRLLRPLLLVLPASSSASIGLTTRSRRLSTDWKYRLAVRIAWWPALSRCFVGLVLSPRRQPPPGQETRWIRRNSRTLRPI